MFRAVVGLLIAALTPLLNLPGYGAANMPSRVVLENVDRYRLPEPLFEGVRVILSYRGESYSPAYLQGLSGAAFRLAGRPVLVWNAFTTAEFDVVCGLAAADGRLA